MMEWAAIVVAEPRNVAHVFAKDVGVPEALRVFDLKAAVTPSPLGSACACTVNARILVVLYLSWLVMWEPGGR